jgi:hypothetical protein
MPENKFYVYQHIRSKDSQTAQTGTPYYIGKGCANRAWDKRRKFAPRDQSYIQIIQEGMTEEEAFALEIELIAKYGRVDQSTGILRNRTAGGEGCKGLRHGPEFKQQRAKYMKAAYAAGTHPFLSLGPYCEERKAKQSIENKEQYANGDHPFCLVNTQPRDPELGKEHSKKMAGAGNPMYGKQQERGICPHCNTEADAPNLNRWHMDKCKKNPNSTRPKASCPHCPASGTPSQMKRYHFDNCKLKS